MVRAMQRRTFLSTTLAAAALSGLRARPSLARTAHRAPHDPLLSPWTGPHGGFPRFDKISPDLLEPALAKAMEMHKAELARIAGARTRPTFANTIAAYEDSGRALDRTARIFNLYASSLDDAPMKKLEAKLTPRLAAHEDEVYQDAALFARIKAVHDAPATAKLAADQQRLVEFIYQRFARRGADLGPADKTRLKAINQELATRYTTFSQNELADEEGTSLLLERQDDLAGLPDTLIASSAAAAAAKGHQGKWLIQNTRSSMEPFLTYSSRRDLRHKGWGMWICRGDNNDAHDNKQTITKILALRAERAKLLGYPTHAHWIIADNMARTPEAAMALIMKVWPAAVARVREEVVDMQKIADAEKAGHAIAPWDYRYYAEKVRKARYDLDENEIKPYLQLDKMREAMFWAAGQLYGFRFKPVHDVPGFHPDVVIYEVLRGKHHVGLWYFDPYARDGKRSGAWMDEWRTQETFKGTVPPIVSNNANFVKGAPGAPVLISWDDARTMFHEFGHALHGLCSNVRYPEIAGTNVKRDFVEFPSQLNEHWFPTKEVLSKFAVHYQTGKPIPDELVAKTQKARFFNQGFLTVEYLMSAIYDLEVHLAPADKPIHPDVFERRTMKEIGAPREIVMRHRPTQFGHIFADDGYSAGYYVYLWADTLTADAAEAFEQAGSFYDKATARRLYDSIMSVGNSIPPEEAFRRFRGRDVDTNALMRDRGFPVSKA
jgi:peptidyl-dipeptidase Dcp